ncbi:MAG: FAD-dependent oxidoreductase [Candidatus Omnitrophota bacterium]
MARDPICSMEVDNEEFIFKFRGKEYFFCSAGCMEKFKNSPDEFLQKYIYDLVIIGAGPAGLTAAVYASVLNIDTFLIAKDIGGQAIDSSKIKNYMGFDFITGKDLVKKFKSQFLQEHYLSHKIGEVAKINRDDDAFEILTKENSKLLARSIIIATGMKRRKLGIPGEEALQRKGISYSSVQDITLFKGLDVVVIGGGNSGVQTANDLNKLGGKVVLISQGKLTADQKDIDTLIKTNKNDILENYDILEIKGKDKVEGVVVQSRVSSKTKHISCKGVFIQVGLLPNIEFCQGLLKLNEKAEIMINHDCSTNAKGIFACGDVTDCFGKRIVIASGEGAKAALSVRKYLFKQKEAENGK